MEALRARPDHGLEKLMLILLAFTCWWADHLLTDCRVDFQDNLFTDQRWCDLAPCLLHRLCVLRDTSYNMPYWNLENRPLGRAADGTWTINGYPLVFFHFSGIDPAHPERLSRHQDRLSCDDIQGLQELHGHYRGELVCYGWPRDAAAPHSYGGWHDAVIPTVLKHMLRDQNPATVYPPSRMVLLMRQLMDTCFAASASAAAQPLGLSVLMDFVHRSRTDVATAFELGTAEGRRLFAQWFYAAGVFDFGPVDLLLLWADRQGLLAPRRGA